MPASSNRRERRLAAKMDKTPWIIRLLNHTGDCETAGVYLDIINTSWRGAQRCSYEYKEGMSWWKLLGTAKLYFAPLHDRFEATVATCWSDETRMLFTTQGKNLLVNITFKGPVTNTLNLILPECILDFSNPEALVQKKSSSIYQTALNSWRRCAMNYSMAQRQELLDTYMQRGQDREWAQILSGLSGQENLEYNICTLAVSEVLTELLHVFRTLAFMDFAHQRGHVLLENNHMFSLSNRALADIESVCTNATSKMSDLPITYRNDGGDNRQILGNFRRFYDVYSAPVNVKNVEFLRSYVQEVPIDLDQVTKDSADHFVYLDAKGNPMREGTHEARAEAKWMLTRTGLHHRYGGFPIFGYYEHEDTAAHWKFLKFDTAPTIYHDLEQANVSGLSVAKWQPLLSTSFELKGRGLRESFPGDEEEVPANVRFYTCSKEMFEALGDNSNINTLDQMNFFIEGFLRMLRRRKAVNGADTCYNTGLVDKEGYFMWLMVPNLMGKFNALQPSVIFAKRGSLYAEHTYRFYRENKYLFMQNNKITVDENSLLHVSDDREHRIPPKLASMSKPQLMDWIRDSVRYSQERMMYNPLYAQPCYSERLDRVCHLIPLYSQHTYNQEHLVGALFVNNNRVATIYTVEMARDHACLFTVPKAEWLPD